MTNTISPPSQPVASPLTDETLQRFRGRASDLDGSNRFPDDDFAELARTGYLKSPLPLDRSGRGLDLAGMAAEQRRLARYAPATALATSMHLYWAGAATDLERLGHPGADSIVDEIARGEIFASGHAEAGNDVPVLLSSTQATRVDGGYCITGRKHFTSLSPVWTRLGVHAMDPGRADGPVVIHGFVTRDSDGVSTDPVWDTLGMRATQSHDTVLDDVFVPDHRIGAIVPAGDPSHPFTGTITVWALVLISNVYLGIAERAFELAVQSARAKRAISLPHGTFANHPFVQHQVAEMYLDLHPVRAMLDELAGDWSDGVDHADEWGPLVMSAKHHAVSAAQRTVSRAMDVVGGSSFYRRHELERLYRDVRAGAYHPPNDAYAHEAIGKSALGVGGDTPRW
jgi:alkylation response protein AidB-like acyl-CoA dehydrogenase